VVAEIIHHQVDVLIVALGYDRRGPITHTQTPQLQ
jgi:hypothetical protein